MPWTPTCRWVRGPRPRRHLPKHLRLETSDKAPSPTMAGHRKGNKTRMKVGCVEQAVAAVGKYPDLGVSLVLVFHKWSPWTNVKNASEVTMVPSHFLRWTVLAKKEKRLDLEARCLPFSAERRENTQHPSPRAISESTALDGSRHRNYPGPNRGRLDSRLLANGPSRLLVSS